MSDSEPEPMEAETNQARSLYDTPVELLSDMDLLLSTIDPEDLKRPRSTWDTNNPRCGFCFRKYRFRKMFVMCHIDPSMKKGSSGKTRQVKACSPCIQHRARYQDVLKELQAREKARRAQEEAEKAAKKRRIDGDGTASSPVAIQDTDLQTTLTQRITPVQLQDAVGEMIIGDGLKLCIVDSPYFRKAMLCAAQMGPQAVSLMFDGTKDIALPHRTFFRDTVVTRIDSSLEKENKIKIDRHLEICGATVLSDGWQSTSGRPIINLIIEVDGMRMLLKAIDTSGDDKTMQYIADIIMEGIRGIGEGNVSVRMDLPVLCMYLNFPALADISSYSCCANHHHVCIVTPNS